MPIAEIPNLIPALPEIFMASAAMALLMLGVFQRKGAGKDGAHRRIRLVSYLSVFTLFFAFLLVVTVSAGTMTTFNNMFIIDYFAAFFKILVLIASAMTIIIAQSYLERQGASRFEFSVLILFATIGMMMMISANDLISLYLGLEMQSLSLYVLASFQRDDARSTEAGLKYFVLGALASGMLLYGSSLIYGFTGTTSFAELAISSRPSRDAPRSAWSSALSLFWRGSPSRFRRFPSTCGRRTSTRARRRRSPPFSRWGRSWRPWPCSSG